MPPKIKERIAALINSEDSIESFISAKCVITTQQEGLHSKTIAVSGLAYCNSNYQICKPRSILFTRLTDMMKLRGKDGYDVDVQIKIDAEKG